MSKLTEVLAAHRWSPSIAAMASYSAGGCFGCMFHGSHDQFVAHVEEAIAAAGLAVVELPEPDQDDDDGIGWSSGELSEWGVYVSRDIADGKVYDQSDGVSPSNARTIASWWLAAANAAEAVTQ